MLIIKQLTDKKCFMCKTTEHTADVKFKDGTFIGVLCKDHLWQAMKLNCKPADSPQNGTSATKSGKEE